MTVVVIMFGLFCAWSTLAFRGATLLEVTETSLALVQDAKLSLMFTLGLSCLLVPFFKNRFATLSRQLAVLAVSALLIVGGIACCVVDTAETVHPFPFVSFGFALAGVGSALSTPFLGILLYSLGSKRATISMLIGYIVSALLCNFVWELQGLARIAATLLIPLGQTGLMAFYMARLNHPSSPWSLVADANAGNKWEWPCGVVKAPLPIGLLVVVFLSGFLGSFVRGGMYYSGFEYAVIASESLVLQAAVMGTLIIVLGLFGKGYDAFSIFWPWAGLPVLVCCIALPFLGESSPTVIATVFTIAHSLFNVFNYTIFVDIALRYHRDVATLFCWGRAFDSLGCIIGFVAGSLFAASFSVTAHLWYVLSLVSSYAMFALFVLVLRNRHVADFVQDEPSELTGENSLPRVEDTCRPLAEEYGLTERETEVLDLLYEGRSIPYISQKLLVSTSTVKTHVQSIYRKFGVHTRQELLDRIRG